MLMLSVLGQWNFFFFFKMFVKCLYFIMKAINMNVEFIWASRDECDPQSSYR